MSKMENKIERLAHLEQILLESPNGLKRAELARRLDVHKSTISRYIDELSRMVHLTEDDQKRFSIDRDRYFNNVTLSIHEVLSLYLASCLISERSDRHNPHIASALRKIGYSVTDYSEALKKGIIENALRMETGPVMKDPAYIHHLEVLTRAWSEGTLTSVTHYSRNRGEDVEYTLGILNIHPYAAGFSIHIMGYSIEESQLRTLRLDRIKDVTLLEEPFDQTMAPSLKEKLKEAWGIWYSNDPPVKVVLRFSPRVAYRIKETIWHPGQSLEEEETGSVIWRGKIAAPKEMYPWIRGWGRDVEILEPQSLREEFAGEIEALREMYGVGEEK